MSESDVKPLGEKVKAARERLRYTREEVGRAIGTSGPVLYQLESGRRPISLETLWELATALGLDPNSFDARLAKRKPSSAADPLADYLKDHEKAASGT
mgnify:CR=1